jgi:pimeloyl-ACP methyl ester carboxylesterase
MREPSRRSRGSFCFIRQYNNVVQYRDYPKGGHFAIHERAAEMAADLRDFFRTLR